MMIRKGSKVNPSAELRLNLQMPCRLNQSPWDVIDFQTPCRLNQSPQDLIDFVAPSTYLRHSSPSDQVNNTYLERICSRRFPVSIANRGHVSKSVKQTSVHSEVQRLRSEGDTPTKSKVTPQQTLSVPITDEMKQLLECCEEASREERLKHRRNDTSQKLITGENYLGPPSGGVNFMVSSSTIPGINPDLRGRASLVNWGLIGKRSPMNDKAEQISESNVILPLETSKTSTKNQRGNTPKKSILSENYMTNPKSDVNVVMAEDAIRSSTSACLSSNSEEFYYYSGYTPRAHVDRRMEKVDGSWVRRKVGPDGHEEKPSPSLVSSLNNNDQSKILKTGTTEDAIRSSTSACFSSNSEEFYYYSGYTPRAHVERRMEKVDGSWVRRKVGPDGHDERPSPSPVSSLNNNDQSKILKAGTTEDAIRPSTSICLSSNPEEFYYSGYISRAHAKRKMEKVDGSWVRRKVDSDGQDDKPSPSLVSRLYSEDWSEILETETDKQ